MNSTLRRILVILPAALLGLTSAGAVIADPGSPLQQARLSEDELVERLRAGGLVVYLRHARTDRKQIDDDEIVLEDCSTQRPLSPAGRAQAEAIGQSIRDLSIPVGKVLTSPYCRCTETAELALGGGEISESLYYARDLTASDKKRLAVDLRGMLAAPPAKGKNTFVVSHTSNLEDAVGIHPRPEGVAWVFEPLPDGDLRALGAILPKRWHEWAATYAPSESLPAEAAP